MTENINKLLREFKNCYENCDFEKIDELNKEIQGYYERNGLTKTENYARYLYDLSLCQTETDKLREAVKSAKAAFDIAEELNLEILCTAAATSLGVAYGYAGNKRPALFWLKKAYDLTYNLVKDRDSEQHNQCLADAALNLGSAYYDIRDYNNALDFHKTALRLQTAENDDYCDNLNLIAYDLEKLGRFDEAAVYLRSSLDILGRLIGENDKDYAANLSYLASVYKKGGDFQKAAVEYERVIRLFKQTGHGDDICCGEAMNKAADIYLKMGDDPGALKLRNEALEIFEKTTGTQSLFYANCLRDMGEIYFNNSIYGKAIICLTKALDIKKSIFAPADPEYFKDAILLTKIYLENKQPDKSCEIMEYLFNNIDEKHPSYRDILFFLASRYVLTDTDTDRLFDLYEKYLKLDPDATIEEFLELAFDGPKKLK
ncbi:MAG: tetratricopeptide repeat protein [Clostridiales bacterium]|nr:tetratricopeptide repeat protein [Clostridiales bacterium]